MPASYAKEDPNCKSDILFIGTTGIRTWVSPPSPPPQCDAEMYIDVIVPAAYTNVEFENINLILEIQGPTGALFVPDPRQGSGVHWGMPKGSSWEESSPAPTPRVRLRNPHDALLSGGINGLSFWLALSGLSKTSLLSFTAAATADRIFASTASCPIQIKDLAIGEQLTGYLDR